MAKYIGGTAMVIMWVNNAGTIAIQQQYTKLNTPWQTDLTEVSSGSALAKAYLPTLKDMLITYEGYSNGTDSPMGTATLAQMEPQMSGTFYWAPFGTAAGKPKGGAFCYIKTADPDYPYADKVTIKLELQVSGELLFDPNIAVWP